MAVTHIPYTCFSEKDILSVEPRDLKQGDQGSCRTSGTGPQTARDPVQASKS